MITGRNFRHLFVVTYGRSGSTLIQGILNASERIHLTGENGNIVQSLFDMVTKLRSAKAMVGKNPSRTPRDPFYGIDFYDEAEICRSLENLVDRQILNSNPKAEETLDFIGFKEIRYPFVPDLAGLLGFMESLFNESRFVFCFRDLTAVLDSGMYAERPEEMKRKFRASFKAFEDAARAFCEGRPNTVILDYERFRDDAGYIRDKLLSIDVDIPIETIASTMKVPHSYTWRGKTEN
jgi:hypothetical protein